MCVSPTDGSDGGLGITGGEDLHLMLTENIFAVNCNQAYYGTVYGRVEAIGVMGGQSVMGTGRLVLVMYADGSSGVGTDGGEEDTEIITTKME